MSASLEIHLEHGPLPRERLAAIADLYGRADPKYASIEFCEHQFNRNPSVASFHAFAQVGERVVGVHNLIPIEGVARGESVPTAKAEALYILEEYRRAQVTEGARSVPLFLATSTRLYRFGMDRGIRVIHMMGAAGLFFRFTGCHELTVPDACATFVIEPPPGTGASALGIRALAWIQRSAAFAAGSLSALAASATSVNAREVDDSDLLPFVREPTAEPLRWTLRRSPENLRWFAGTGRLEFARCGAASALVRPPSGPGDGVEILAWGRGPARVADELALLRHIVTRAIAVKATRVVAWHSSLEPGRLPSLLGALGFVTVRRPRKFYVKADDPFFVDPANLSFSPFFWATF